MRLPLIAALAATPAFAEPDPANWEAVLAEAEGQTVYWHAWGGSTTTNDFIAWVGEQVAEQGVTLEHVKLADTADAVSLVLSERQAGKTEGGSVDLIWINGANFASMKREELLFGPFAEDLPNWRFVDVEGKTVTTDFTIPTDGYESPWAMAQVVFIHDSARLEEPPASAEALLDWAQANPGRFTFPQPPDFLGTTFLKQMLIELVEDPGVLQGPVGADYAEISAPLWDFMDALTPVLWRQGRAYPQTGPRQLQLMNDGEVDIAISFSPGEATAAIANYELPSTARTYVLEDGTLGNASFVAIPFNANAKAGAMVVADTLLSPEAQLRAQMPDVLGYGTVLDMDALDPADRAAFEALDLGVATLSPEELGQALPEPHPSWAERLAADWVARYGVAN
ncbi:ABC transporter substrate-binding protein [Jannaschia seohaensis]|uniref:Putative thiamine transport system substrate-binding protein n=1 Tax=Jannaschia seohaensis TaxID=475081 RepID=A0A2Y9ABI6_9RHOB|nr:ABC transporter substrate-binding protein [Jannaschia seohaensis]PWJ20896.1 putative thiamine transport system substrate-binding protein [Jannaschia seohaensis]SSA41306.1 putative thiamine transport system substrate-binding protein [Jannaschia seohaensis]